MKKKGNTVTGTLWSVSWNGAVWRRPRRSVCISISATRIRDGCSLWFGPRYRRSARSSASVVSLTEGLLQPSNVCSTRRQSSWRSETFRFLEKMCRWIPMGSIYFFSIVLMASEEKSATFPQFCDALRKSFPSFLRKMAFSEEKFSISSVKFWGKVKNGNRLDFAKHGKYYK